MAHPGNEGAGLPCAFALLPNRTQETYELVLSTIMRVVGQVISYKNFRCILLSLVESFIKSKYKEALSLYVHKNKRSKLYSIALVLNNF